MSGFGKLDKIDAMELGSKGGNEGHTLFVTTSGYGGNDGQLLVANSVVSVHEALGLDGSDVEIHSVHTDHGLQRPVVEVAVVEVSFHG